MAAKSLSSPVLKKFLYELTDGASRILLKHFMKVRNIERKVGAGIVTEADKNAEAYLMRNIFRKFPKSSIITEETGEHGKSQELVWVIDPLDGTTNYAHGFPWFCVSIGVYENGKPRAGVIYQPLTKERFFAETGKGAYLNGKRLKVSTTNNLQDSLLGTGFYYNTGEQLKEEIEIFRRVQDKALGVRRPGSAAMDLAYVACGRYDGFWERGLASWDVAAGFILVREAGGKVTGYDGGDVGIHDAEVVASNGRLHRPILELIQG
jgi:myo-inositol-1(or 4)-monophosphatase